KSQYDTLAASFFCFQLETQKGIDPRRVTGRFHLIDRGPVKVIEIIRIPQNVLNRPVAARCSHSARFRTIQNNSDLAQGPHPIRPSKVGRSDIYLAPGGYMAPEERAELVARALLFLVRLTDVDVPLDEALNALSALAEQFQSGAIVGGTLIDSRSATFERIV